MVYKSLWHAHIPMETSKRRQELKLDERGHGDKCTFLALGDSVLNDLPALRVWSLPLCTRQIHIHPKTGVVFVFGFGSQLTLEIPAEKQLYFSFGQFFDLSSIFLWLFPTNSIYLLPPTFFFFARRELTSDFRSVAAITDNMGPHSSRDNTS